jgi:hypothetical protein
VLDCTAGVVASMWPVLQVVVLPARLAVALAGCAGSVLSNSYNFFKDIWETLSSIFQLNHMSEAQQSTFDMTTLKTLWNDLFSQIFRAMRGILNGILVFFYSCNRHRLRYLADLFVFHCISSIWLSELIRASELLVYVASPIMLGQDYATCFVLLDWHHNIIRHHATTTPPSIKIPTRSLRFAYPFYLFYLLFLMK